MKPTVFLTALIATGLAVAAPAQTPLPDTPFWQDWHEPAPLASPAENDVRALLFDRQGRLWAATAAGVRFRQGGTWQTPENGAALGLTNALAVAADGSVLAAADTGLWKATARRAERLSLPKNPIGVVSVQGKTIFAGGPDGIWRSGDGTRWSRIPGAWHRRVQALLPRPNNTLWIGTGSGLYLQPLTPGKPTRRLGTPDTLLSSNVYSLTLLPDGTVAVGSSGGIDFYKNDRRVRSLSQGMPNRNAQSIARDPNGRLWVATKLGVARWDGSQWNLRHSRRWLLSDSTRTVAIAPDGTAWVGTSAGVDAIHRKRLTLAEKADYFLQIVRKRHIRPPGLVGPAVLVRPGDLSESFIEDDDNDGEHTGMYLAMESLRYAVTKNPEAQKNAQAAFHAMEILQQATGTPHFIARSVLPIGTAPRHEVDRTFTDAEAAESRRTDPREKLIEKRWLPTADGKWLWKRDASSDEIDGHLFGYVNYYDLAATPAEKQRVRALVDRIVGGIVDHGFVLADIDGKATRWGNWSPASLNGDPTWTEERNGNSTEILAHLGVAYHITGKEKYRAAARYLIEKHGYAKNMAALRYPTPSEQTHINDELLSMVFPNLFGHLVLPSLQPAALSAIRGWHLTCRADGIPFYDFVYNRFSGKTVPLGPALTTLRGWPLDMIEWTVDNRGREDVTFDKTPGREEGRLTKILPREEMGLVMWDQEPYKSVIGRGGEREDKPTDWLLAYWMGRYWGLLGGPKK